MALIGQVIEPTLRVVTSLSEDWMLYVMVIILFLLGYVRFRYTRSFSDLFSSIVNINKLREIMRQELVITSTASQILLVSSLLSVAMFFYLCLKVTQLELILNLSGFLLYLTILVGLVVMYGLKFIFLKLVQLLYKGDFSLNEYNYNVNLYLKVAGIILIPIVIVLAFTSGINSKFLVGLGLFLVFSSIIWRYWRGIQNAVLLRISFFYIILYLCAFEILPVITMAKLIF